MSVAGGVPTTLPCRESKMRYLKLSVSPSGREGLGGLLDGHGADGWAVGESRAVASAKSGIGGHKSASQPRGCARRQSALIADPA